MYGGLGKLKRQARNYAMSRGWDVPATPAARLAVTGAMRDPPSVKRLATLGGIAAFPKHQPGKVLITKEQYEEYNQLRQGLPGYAQRNNGRGNQVGTGGGRGLHGGDQGAQGSQVVRRGGRGGNSRERGGAGDMERGGQTNNSSS